MPMRIITDHHDHHGLAETMLIEADPIDPDAGGASHHYVVSLEGAQLARIQFWHGPRHQPNSMPGILDSVLLAILIDRMRCFNNGPLRAPGERARDDALRGSVDVAETPRGWASQAGCPRTERAVTSALQPADVDRGFQLYPRGLVITRRLSPVEWETLGRLLAKAHDRTAFALGDWLNYGRSRPDEEERADYAYARTVTGRSYE